ncbi:MAG: metal-dependent hydrolase [Candidatus Doudnabacteria bacterium]
MLPPGHIAGGYLAGKIASIWIPALRQPEYLALSSFFGFVPDLDTFWTFYKNKRMISTDRINHRQYFTHAPLLYLAIFLLWYILFPHSRLIALTFILGTWSHFILDTFSYEGIMWMWPFSTSALSILAPTKISIRSTEFFGHWLEVAKKYSRLGLAKAEAMLIIIAILTLIYSKH